MDPFTAFLLGLVPSLGFVAWRLTTQSKRAQERPSIATIRGEGTADPLGKQSAAADPGGQVEAEQPSRSNRPIEVHPPQVAAKAGHSIDEPVCDPMIDGPALSTLTGTTVLGEPQAQSNDVAAPLAELFPQASTPSAEGWGADTAAQAALRAEAVSELSAERMLASAGAELLDSVSAIESRAHLLLAAMGDPAAVPGRAEGLWMSMRRAHGLCRKLQCYTGQDHSRPNIRATALGPLVKRLREELAKDTDDGLRVSIRAAKTLQLALCDGALLYDVLRFSVDALLAIAPDAEGLSVALQNTFDEDSGPLVIVELQVPLTDERPDSPYAEERLQLGYAAARNLVKEQGAFLSLDQQPGAGATILISLPATARPGLEEPREPLAGAGQSPGNGAGAPEMAGTNQVDTGSVEVGGQLATESLDAALTTPELLEVPRHPFGGVLVLEDQPAVRTLISTELRALNRNIFACPNGQAASSLIQATPERFEMLIAEIEGQGTARHKLALETLRAHGDLKLISLTNGMEDPLSWPDDVRDRVAELSKPFGVHELRQEIRRMLSLVTG